MDTWVWVLVGLAAARMAADVVAMLVMVAAVFGAASRPYNADDTGETS